MEIHLNNNRKLILTPADIANLKAMPETINADQSLQIGKYSISHEGKGYYIVEQYIKSMMQLVPRAEFRLP